MDCKDIIKAEKEIEKLNIIKSENKLITIKSDYFIQKLFNYIQNKISLKIIKNNINIQKRLNININNYKKFSEKFSSIEIEIKTIQDGYGPFINIKKEVKNYFHIYFNGNKEEIKRTKLNKEDKLSKITIIIDYQIESFYKLFYYCKCIESINFKKFYRTNITNMNSMFIGSSLKEINLSNFNTNNVNDMSYMFYRCTKLKELNLSNFNTTNVTNMSHMLEGCRSLIKLNLSNINTNNLTNMRMMFYECSSLKELNLSNFNTNNVNDMSLMFYECSSLKELNLSNFKTNNLTDMKAMFGKCSDELKLKIRNQYKNFQEVAFEDNYF